MILFCAMIDLVLLVLRPLNSSVVTILSTNTVNITLGILALYSPDFMLISLSLAGLWRVCTASRAGVVGTETQRAGVQN